MAATSPGRPGSPGPGSPPRPGRRPRRRPAGPPRSAPGRRTSRAAWTTAPPAGWRPGTSRRRSGPRGCAGSGRPRRWPGRPGSATSSTAPGPLPSAIARPIAWLPSCVTTRTSGRISLATRAISRLARSSSTTQTTARASKMPATVKCLRRTAEGRDRGHTPAEHDRQLGGSAYSSSTVTDSPERCNCSTIRRPMPRSPQTITWPCGRSRSAGMGGSRIGAGCCTSSRAVIDAVAEACLSVTGGAAGVAAEADERTQARDRRTRRYLPSPTAHRVVGMGNGQKATIPTGRRRCDVFARRGGRRCLPLPPGRRHRKVSRCAGNATRAAPPEWDRPRDRSDGAVAECRSGRLDPVSTLRP